MPLPAKIVDLFLQLLLLTGLFWLPFKYNSCCKDT
uniref:Uncharacterized protein n=1 Tax=Rhizophora mucronata TaxID=61149 RepID=A0A2P2NWT1_RHIMU